jgi:dipeptidyl aminopeptidase/acylaminoacyl peptidase
MTHPMTPDALVCGLTIPADPQISPDGRWVVHTVTSSDRETSQVSTQLWFRDRDGGHARRLTWSGNTNRNPRWAPDGQSIAFVSDRVRRTGLFVLPVAEPGEAREIIREPRNIAEFAWSPDGRQIAYVVPIDPQNPDEVEQPAGAAPRVRVTSRLDYKADGWGYLGDRRRQVVVVDVATGARRQVTEGPFDHLQPGWSPDGRWLVAQEDRGSFETWLRLCDRQSGETRMVGFDRGYVRLWAWSPRADRILLAGDEVRTGWLGFFLYSLATGEMRQLTPELRCLPDAGRLGVAPPAWPIWLDDRVVLFHAFEAGKSGLYTIDTETGRVENRHSWPALHAGLSVDKTHRYAAFGRSAFDVSDELCVLDLADGTDSTITRCNRAILEERSPALWERFEVPRGGLTIEAWLLKPPGFDPARRYPVILDVHGGPQAFYGHSFDQVQQMLATHGFLVVFCNPRGSTTYGKDFTLRVRRDWGGEDFQDLMAVLDAALERPYADRDRTGIYGSSYGGYMVAWTLGQTDRFKAAVCRAPVFDLESAYGTSDTGSGWKELEYGGPPWERREWYAARSPSRFAHRARTPTLIICGEDDQRTPIGQSEQMFVTLKRAGCEAVLARYPGGAHTFFRPGGSHPAHRLDFLERVLAWFTTHLGAHA